MNGFDVVHQIIRRGGRFGTVRTQLEVGKRGCISLTNVLVANIGSEKRQFSRMLKEGINKRKINEKPVKELSTDEGAGNEVADENAVKKSHLSHEELAVVPVQMASELGGRIPGVEATLRHAFEEQWHAASFQHPPQCLWPLQPTNQPRSVVLDPSREYTLIPFQLQYQVSKAKKLPLKHSHSYEIRLSWFS